MKFLSTLMGACLMSGVLSAAEPNDIWIYFPFDRNCEAIPEERVKEIRPAGATFHFEEGQCGSAISLPAGTPLAFKLDISDFPKSRGCLILRYKPYASWKTDAFLLENVWASMEVTNSIAYYARINDSGKAMKYATPGQAAAMAGKWHVFVMEWDDCTRRVWLDGKKVVDRTDEALHQPGYFQTDWHLGHLPGIKGRPDSAFANAAFDEFAILSCNLTPQDIQALAEGKSVKQIIGMEERFLLPRRTFLRNEPVPVILRGDDPEKEVELTIRDDKGKVWSLKKCKIKDFPVTLPPYELRAGNYTIKAGSAETWLTIRERLIPDYVIATGGVPLTDLDYLEKHHVSCVGSNVNDFINRTFFDRIFKHGIVFMPNLNVIELWTQSSIHNKVKKAPYYKFDKETRKWEVNPAEAKQFLQMVVPLNGDPEVDGGSSSASPFSPVAFDMMTGIIDQYLAIAGDHPAWYAVSFQDEVPLRTGTWNPMNRYMKGGWKDVWHCFVMTWKDGERRIYLDGKLVTEKDNVAPLKTVLGNWRIGYLPGHNVPNSNSVYDDLGVFSRALSADECALLWQQKEKALNRFPFAEKDLWAYWNFDGKINAIPAARMKNFKLKMPDPVPAAAETDVSDASMDAIGMGEDEAQPDSALAGPFVPGKTGKAIDLKDRTYLDIQVNVKNFPQTEGSLVFWFKPHETCEAMAKKKPCYFFDEWTKFSVEFENAYCTSGAAGYMRWPAILPTYGDYSVYARKYFKEQTGLDIAWPMKAKPGTVFPENEPYLLWTRTIGVPGDTTGPGFDTVYKRLSDHVKKTRPDILSTNSSGCEYGYIDAVADWNYPFLMEGKSLRSDGFGYPFLDYTFARHRARQKNGARKPVWAALGWWSPVSDTVPKDWWHIDMRINTEVALASGVHMMKWNVPGSIRKEDSPMTGFLTFEKGRAEFERWTDWIYANGAVLQHLKPAEANAAVIFSETDTAGKMHDNNGYYPNAYRLFSALRTIGMNPELVTDDTILAGGLDKYQAVFLADFDYSSEKIWEKICAYKGKVFHDAASALHPEGAIPLGFVHNELPENVAYPENLTVGLTLTGTKLDKIVPAGLRRNIYQLEDPSHVILPFRLDGGEAKYIFLVNTDWRKGIECGFTVSEEGYLYDFLTGKEQKKSDRFTIDAGEWRVFLLLPKKAEALTLEVETDGRTVKVSAAVNGIKAPIPFAFRLIAPDGTVLPQSRTTSFDVNGQWKDTFYLSPLMDPAGEYTVEAENASLGLRADCRFIVQ